MYDTPMISLLHPTARVSPSEGFPRGWRDACRSFFVGCDRPEWVEYVIAVHESRWAEFFRHGVVGDIGHSIIEVSDNTVLSIEPWGRVRVVLNTGRDCVVDQVNAAARASTGKVLFGVMDDLRAPAHWDTLILETLMGCPIQEFQPEPFYGAPAGYLEGNAIVLCSSGAPVERDRELMICHAMTRVRYETLGYVLDPDFESMFADNWSAWQARDDVRRGNAAILERFGIRFEHLHPTKGTMPGDAVYDLQNRPEAYFAGQVAFHQKVSGARVLVACLPGESFRSEIVGSRFQLIDDLKANTRYGIVAPHWCYTSNVYATRIELADNALLFPSITRDEDLVLWIDDDNDCNFGHVSMLLDDLAADPDLGVVVGWCWCDHSESESGSARSWVMSCGRQDLDLACLRFTGEDFDAAVERGSFLISSADIAPHRFWSGFPVVLMRRSVLAALGPRAFVPINDSRVKYGFTSEDTAFFLNAAWAGVKCAVDIRVQVPHVKWRAIQPQYVPAGERAAVERNAGRQFGAGDKVLKL